MKAIVLTVALFGCLLIPANERLMSSGDDDDYFAVATAIAYGKFPYFTDEYHIGERMPFASVGPGVLASPFVLSFSLIDRLKHEPIAAKREKDNRYWTWSLFGFHFAVYLYLLIGIMILHETLKHWGSAFAALTATQLALFGGGGLLIYAFRRPVMSHVFEFFTVSLALFLVSLALRGRVLRFHAALVGLCAAFIVLTRYNNVFLSIGLMAVYCHIQHRARQLKLRDVVYIFMAFLAPISLFRILPVIANGFSEYDLTYAGSLSRVIPESDPIFYALRLREIVLGVDMGLLYTAPVALISIGALWLYRNRLPKAFLFLGILGIFNIYFGIIWKSFGSFYGYRYITFTLVPLLSVYLVTLTDTLLAHLGRRAVILLSLAIAYFPVVSMLVFERSHKYQFTLITNAYGVDTYTQPTFHADLFIDVLQNPLWPVAGAIRWSFVAPLLSGTMPYEHLLQRLLLYVAPPVVFMLCYEPARRRLRNTVGA